MFPKPLSQFDTYANQALIYLSITANKTRLLVSGVNFSALSGLIGPPVDPVAGNPPGTNSTPHTWNFVRPQIAQGLGNSALFTEQGDLRKNIEAKLTLIFNDIPDSAIIPMDETVLHILKKAHHQPPSAPAQITETAFITLSPHQGGDILGTARTAHDAAHASKLPGAELELAWKIFDTPAAVADFDAAKSPDKKIFSHAHFAFALGQANRTKIVGVYSRWVYPKHDDLNGSWGEMFTCVIA